MSGNLTIVFTKRGTRCILCTGKSLSEPLILASTNPQYDKRLFIDLPVLTWKLQAQNMLCT
jgi:hypothetical protein